MVARIGNGMFARSSQGASIMDRSRRLQAACGHVQRDPQGTCYRCGGRLTVEATKEPEISFRQHRAERLDRGYWPNRLEAEDARADESED